MSEKRFTCVLGKDYHIINNNVDDMTYFLQDGNDVVLVINLMNRLVEENEQLRGINKEIGDDLYNCRLNKDIVSEKLKLWQDTLAEYDIYTIKDFKELMKNDN